MRFLVVGLGSMGKRRIRNLQFIKAGEILGFDPRPDRREEARGKYGIRTFDNFDHAMEAQPDVLVISTPPDLHMHYALLAARNDKHFFTEVNVLNEGMAELIELCSRKKIVAAPSCTLRFQPSIRLIKEFIHGDAIGPILAFTYHVGQYLPDWHPWEDYRAFYAGKRETGACREIFPFELIWLTWLLGEVESVTCLKDKVSSLDVNIDDVYQVLLRFKCKTLGHLLVDAVARVPCRTCRFLGERGVIEWIWMEKKVRIYDAASGKWTEHFEVHGIVQEGYLAAEDMYIDEMACFVGAIKGQQPYPYTYAEDKQILELLYAAEQSSDQGVHIHLNKSKMG